VRTPGGAWVGEWKEMRGDGAPVRLLAVRTFLEHGQGYTAGPLAMAEAG